jgi:diaminopimelate decarboxylase
MRIPVDNNKVIPTPYFLLDEVALETEVNSLQGVVDRYWQNSIIGYSVKTNSFPPLLSRLKNLGLTAEVVSFDEYELAIRVGFKPDQIICNGPIKDISWINQIIENYSYINIDSKNELDIIKIYAIKNPDHKLKVGLRVNVDLETCFPGESNAGVNGSRFGFSYESGELSETITLLQKVPNIALVGLHLHVSTKTRSLDIYKYLTNMFSEIVSEFKLKQIEYFDIGGGFYGGVPDKPGWNDYLMVISQELQAHGYCSDNLKLIIEPGVSLIASVFSYRATVVDVKKTSRQQYAVLDGSRIHVDPMWHKESYFYEIQRSGADCPGQIVDSQELVGFTCMENDRFLMLKNEKSLQVGDFVIFKKVGAYTMTLSPLFISYYPAVYSIDVKGKVECLREKWTVDEFLNKSKF